MAPHAHVQGSHGVAPSMVHAVGDEAPLATDPAAQYCGWGGRGLRACVRPRGWRCCSLRPTAAHCAGPCLLLLVRAAPWEVLILGEQAEEEVGDRVPLFLLCSWCF